MLREILKQLIDQPLHILMSIASVYLFTWLFQGRILVAIGITIFWETYREYLQWPSSRWWDPPLDWIFQALGIFIGYKLFTGGF